MLKPLKIFDYFAFLVCAFSSCGQIYEENEVAVQIETGQTLTAICENDDTKTGVIDGGTKIYWDANDEILVSSGSASAKFISTNEHPETSAVFIGPNSFCPEVDQPLMAVYPYRNDIELDRYSIKLTLPSEQVACPGTFSKGTNIAAAVSNSRTLRFRNIGGGIRFCVNEAGISKVVFEGMNGESLSGKLNIYFSPDGLPIVESIEDPCPFVTLLAPDGQYFEVGKWYYIVTAPVGLENGYKLRFYKDDKYAKRISNNAVSIKRNIYGSISNADDGIEYEEVVTHAPTSLEDIIESVNISESSSEMISNIIESYSNIDNAGEELIERIKNVEGIIDAKLNDSHTSISVLQKDSICINYLMNTSVDDLSFENEDSYYSTMTRSSYSMESSSLDIFGTKSSYASTNNKRALILAPFYSEPEDHTVISSINDYYYSLLFAGIPAENIDYYINKQVSLNHFRGNFLDNYDVVIIRTHGGTFTHAYNNKGKWYDNNNVTCLATSVPWSEELVRSMYNSGLFNWDEIYVCGIGNERYLAVCPSYLSNASFNDSMVMIGACESAMIPNDSQYGDGTSMISAFLNRNAGFVSGYSASIDSYLADDIMNYMLLMTSGGISAQKAGQYLKTSQVLDRHCSSYKNAINALYSFWQLPLPDLSGKNNRLYTVFPENEDYYLVRKEIELDDVFPLGNSQYYFSWNSDYNNIILPVLEYGQILSYSYDHPDVEEFNNNIDIGVHYDIYIDGRKILQRNFPDYSLCQTITINPSNEPVHHWYVEAVFTDGDVVIDRIRSQEKEFIVESINPDGDELEAVDLGLSVKWASCNLGASKPEDYGDYYAWGEVETDGNYGWDYYRWGNGSNHALTKYNFDSSFGTVDNKTVLESNDDIAHLRYGGSWHIPTEAEWKELFEECNTEVITNNGKCILKVISRTNNNSIIIPAAGFYSSSNKYQATTTAGGLVGYYWSSSLDQGSPFYAVHARFIETYTTPSINSFSRCSGFPIRPVSY